MSDHPPVGTNCTAPDLVAKITGRAKYAEDDRADGTLFCKLLLSPMPQARGDGVGDDVFRRAPVTPDIIPTSFEAGQRMHEPLTVHV
jgi:hypothetical protein